MKKKTDKNLHNKTRAKQLEHDLKERVKELECLYNISSEIESSLSIEKMMPKITIHIANGLQYPEISVSRIVIDGKSYESKDLNNEKIINSLSNDIIVEGKRRGKIEFFYVEKEFSKDFDTSYLKEEENLIKEISRMLGKTILKNDLEKKVNRYVERLEILLAEKTRESEELRKSKTKLQTFFNAITDIVIMMDTDFNILMSNHKQISNESKCYKILFNRDDFCENCPTLQVFKEKKPISLEKKIGDEHYLLQAYPIINSDGEVEGALEFSRIITKEKNMELQLRQADKLASLGQLVSGIAHEINNPNTFIKGNISIFQEAFQDILPILDEYYKMNPDLKIARLKYGTFKENITVLLEDMSTGALRIKNIVRDLRKFARKDEGLLSEELNIKKIIESCIRLVKNQIKRNTNIVVDIDENIPVIKGNIQKIEQVIVNLLINASQAMEKKRGTIKIRAEYLSEKEEIRISIKDNGKGMDENTIKQIFNPFFTTKRNCGGTGLGLSIAYGIIKEHNGRIEVESEIGKGTNFVIFLPKNIF